MQTSVARIQFRLHAAAPPGKAGSPEKPRSANGRLPRVTQVMALVVQFQDMIEQGEARDYADLARLGCLTRERMSQIMELVWLAPDIQEEILGFPPSGRGRFPISEVAVRRVAEKLDWAEQRDLWRKLKQDKHLG